MSSAFDDCDALHFALLERSEAACFPALPDAAAAALDAHLAACSACRRDLARAERRVGLVGGLARVAAPDTLDGAVVAALQAGARQDRAARAVAGLTPVPAPDDLARRVALPRAPAVLERLVAEDLADPQKAVASRYTRRLERLRAPTVLEERLGRRPQRAPSRFLPQALLVLALLLTAGALVLAHVLSEGRRGGAAAPAQIVLTVERVDSVRHLDPAAGAILSGFTGGLLDADRLSREEM